MGRMGFNRGDGGSDPRDTQLQRVLYALRMYQSSGPENREYWDHQLRWMKAQGIPVELIASENGIFFGPHDMFSAPTDVRAGRGVSATPPPSPQMTPPGMPNPVVAGGGQVMAPGQPAGSYAIGGGAPMPQGNTAMADNSFVGHAGGERTGTADVMTRVQRALQVLTSPASSADKYNAQGVILSAFQQNPNETPRINAMLKKSGFIIVDGKLLWHSPSGEWIPPTDANGQPWTNGAPGTGTSMMGQSNQWKNAQLKLSQGPGSTQPPPGSVRMPGVDPNDKRSVDELNLQNDINSRGGVDAVFGGSTPGDIYGSSDYGNSFFRGTPGAGINELAGSPGTAWSMYLMQGGPNGGSLQNAGISEFGQNDFNAAMDLAPYLTGTGGGKGSGLDILNFTQGMMDRGTQAGQYVDPSKVFNQTIQGLQGQPLAAQEAGISKLIDSLGAYMDPTRYAMLRARIQQVMDQYITQKVTNPTGDQSGLFLQMIQQAAGF